MATLSGSPDQDVQGPLTPGLSEDAGDPGE